MNEAVWVEVMLMVAGALVGAGIAIACAVVYVTYNYSKDD